MSQRMSHNGPAFLVPVAGGHELGLHGLERLPEGAAVELYDPAVAVVFAIGDEDEVVVQGEAHREDHEVHSLVSPAVGFVDEGFVEDGLGTHVRYGEWRISMYACM